MAERRREADQAADLWLRAYLASDGCTLAIRIPELEGCCRAHDADYATGTDEDGIPLTRAEADARMYFCMHGHGRPWVALRRWLAVRVGAASRWRMDVNIAYPPHGPSGRGQGVT